MRKRRTSGITPLPSGRYQILFYDASGQRHRPSFAREKDARAALDKARMAVRNREYVAPADVPTVEQAARAWLEAKKVAPSKHGGPVKESTIEFWANHINRFIVPTLGPIKMDRLEAELIEKQRDVWKGMGLTARSINKVLTTLSAIFDKQLKARKIRFNPVKLADRMAVGSNEVGENNETDTASVQVSPSDVYSPDQLLRLIESADEGFARTALTAFSLLGPRHNELLGFMWPDMDFDRKEITITRSWSGRYRDGEPIFWIPKSKHSVRKLQVPDELCLALKKWKLQCPASKWNLMFPKPDGRPQDRKTVWRAMDTAVKKANERTTASEKLRRLTVHSLRHSFASIHLMNGTPIPEVSAMLGHANVNITLTVYAHFVPKMRTDSADRFAAVIFGDKKSSEANAEKGK